MLVSAYGQAQRVELQKYTRQNGIPFFDLSCMAQDAGGFFWFSDGKQVFSYEGNRFLTLPAARGVQPGYIDQIIPAGDSIFFREKDAVYVFQKDSVRRSWLSGITRGSIDLCWKKNRWWWLETDGLYSWQNGTKTKAAVLPAGQTIRNQLQHLLLLNDSIFVSFEAEKSLFIFNINQKKGYTHPLKLRDITVTADHQLLALQTGTGLLLVKAEAGGRMLNTALKVPYPVLPGKLFTLTSDRQNRCWFVQTGHSLVCMDTSQLIREYKEENGFAGGWTKQLLIDREDNAWIYSVSSLYKIANSPYTVFTQKEGLSTTSYNSLLYDPQRKTLLLGWPGGIDQLDSAHHITRTAFSKTSNDRCFLYASNGHSVTTQQGNRLFTFTWNERSALQLSNSIRLFPEQTFGYAFPVVYNQRYYTATDAGIFSAYGNEVQPESDGQSIRCIARIQDSFLLAGRLQTGLILYKFNPHSKSRTLIPVDSLLQWPDTKQLIEKIRCIYVDETHTAWIGTRTDGLFTCSVINNKLVAGQRSRVSPEFNNPIIWYLFRGPDKNLLAITSSEVYAVHRDTDHVFLKKHAALGLDDHIEYAAWSDTRNWLLTSDALWEIPFSPSGSPLSYACVITSLRNGNRSFLFPAPGQQFSFASSENACEIHFSCNYFIDEKQVRFRHRINGGEWSAYTYNHTLSLPGLSPGVYSVEAEALLPDGRVVKAANLQIRIRPPFYRTAWFLLLCTALLLATVYWFYRNKLNRLRHEERIRDKIARDLHDDIGSTLSGIHLSSKAALQKLDKDTGNTRVILEKISDRTEHMMEAMSDIVWSIHPKHDTVGDMLVRMKEYAAEMLESAGIEYIFLADAKTSTRKLDLAVRKEIFLLFKEAVNNVVRHSGAKKVQVILQQQNRIFSLQVSDDGKGFDDKRIRPGNGLKNMKERARQAGGECMIQTESGKGTTVLFRLPVT